MTEDDSVKDHHMVYILKIVDTVKKEIAEGMPITIATHCRALAGPHYYIKAFIIIENYHHKNCRAKMISTNDICASSCNDSRCQKNFKFYEHRFTQDYNTFHYWSNGFNIKWKKAVIEECHRIHPDNETNLYLEATSYQLDVERFGSKAHRTSDDEVVNFDFNSTEFKGCRPSKVFKALYDAFSN